MLKRYLVIAILLFSNVFYLHASSNDEDIIIAGNEERIAKGIFSHILKLAPADHTSQDFQRLTLFRTHVQNTLMTKKFNSSEISDEVTKTKEALENIRTNLNEQINLCTVISSFLRDFSYTPDSELSMENQREAFLKFAALIKLKEINAFYENANFPVGKACGSCHFKYSDRTKVNSRVMYTCSLCGLGK